LYCEKCRLPASPPALHAPLRRPIDHRLTGTFGCRWRATHSHGRQRAIACLWSEAGALRACRLPIQQDAMTGTGLQAMKRRVSGEDCSAAARNLPSAIRFFFRQPRGVRSSVRDVATRCSLSRHSGNHRAASSSRRGGVGVLVHFGFFSRSEGSLNSLVSRGGRQAFGRDIRARVRTNGPSRSAACRPTVFHTLTSLHALPSLLKSPVTLRVLCAKGSGCRGLAAASLEPPSCTIGCNPCRGRDDL